MSDDFGFYRKQKKEETLENSSGLTPLNFCVDECNRILNRGHIRDGLSTVRPFAQINTMSLDSNPLNKGLPENTEIQRYLSGLCSPLGFCVDIQKRRNLNER